MTGGMHYTPSHTNVFKFLNFQRTFSGPITSTRTALTRDLFSYGFPRKLRAGTFGSYDKNFYLPDAWSTEKASSQFLRSLAQAVKRNVGCMVYPMLA